LTFIPGPFGLVFPSPAAMYQVVTFPITLLFGQPNTVTLSTPGGAAVKSVSVQGPPARGTFVPGSISLINDPVPPTVVSSSISDGATGILLGENIVIEMSENINPDTVNASTVIVKDSDGNIVEGDVYLSADYRKIIFVPKYGFKYGTTYHVELRGVKDWGGQ